MEGELRPGLRADDEEEDEEVTVAVLELTVVPEEEVVVEAVAMAEGAWGSLADGSTFRWIFSTLTAAVSLDEMEGRKTRKEPRKCQRDTLTSKKADT